MQNVGISVGSMFGGGGGGGKDPGFQDPDILHVCRDVSPDIYTIVFD